MATATNKADREYRQRRRLQDAAQRIKEGLPAESTVRKFHHVLRLLLKQQLHLFYGKVYEDTEFLDKTRAKEKLEEFDADFQTILGRLSTYMAEFARNQKNKHKSNLFVRASLEQLELDPAGVYTLDEVKKQYRRLARRTHPDINGDNGESKDKMQLLNQAYEYLKGVL